MTKNAPPPPPSSPDQTCASVEAYSFILCCNIWYLGQKLRQRAEPSTSLQRLPQDQRKAHPKQELFGWTMLCHRTPNMGQTVMQSKIQLNLNHQIITHQVKVPLFTFCPMILWIYSFICFFCDLNYLVWCTTTWLCICCSSNFFFGLNFFKLV